MSPRLHGQDASTGELNQSYPHRRTHQSCYNRHEEHINPCLIGEHINPTTIAMENTSIQASQENTSILLQSSWRTHHLDLTGKPIILLHKGLNHLVPQESKSSCSSAHHQGTVIHHPLVVYMYTSWRLCSKMIGSPMRLGLMCSPWKLQQD